MTDEKETQTTGEEPKAEEAPENKDESLDVDNSSRGPEAEDKTEELGIPEPVRRAEQAAKDIKDGLDRREKLLEEEKKLQDRKESFAALGGGSPAGGSKEDKKEMSNQEYKDRIMAGENPQI